MHIPCHAAGIAYLEYLDINAADARHAQLDPGSALMRVEGGQCTDKWRRRVNLGHPGTMCVCSCKAPLLCFGVLYIQVVELL